MKKTMTYEIEQYELHVQRYRIEANDEANAIAKLFLGEGDPLSLEFVNIADDEGMSILENPDLSSQLFDQGVVKSGDTIIGSIRSIKQVE